jgi:hypothetical protein
MLCLSSYLPARQSPGLLRLLTPAAFLPPLEVHAGHGDTPLLAAVVHGVPAAPAAVHNVPVRARGVVRSVRRHRERDVVHLERRRQPRTVDVRVAHSCRMMRIEMRVESLVLMVCSSLVMLDVGLTHTLMQMLRVL